MDGQRITTKLITDIESIPKCTTTAHVIHETVCNNCRMDITPDTPGIPGSSLGPNLQTFCVQLHHNNMGLGSIRDTINEFFGAGVCKATIQHGLSAAAERLAAHAEDIRRSLYDSVSQHGRDAVFGQRQQGIAPLGVRGG